jgi:uncharacterized protein YjbI with pentapeptide repeats
MKIGDFVKGKENAPYAVTKGLVLDVIGGQIKVKVLEHTSSEDIASYFVDPVHFEVIGHQKEFNRDEFLELIRKGGTKAAFEYDLSEANLSYADLSKADLSESDLSEADLSYANLRRANLRRANLSEANLSYADLSEADLRSADLSDADLSKADLSYANLRRANLSEANLSYADLSEADLSCANLSEANLIEANLSEADLSCANLSEANLIEANLIEANLDFSCLPLRCGGLRWKIDKRIACQIAYHLCSMQCDDTEFVKMRNSILDFANQFHRADTCGKLLEK